MKRKKEIEVNDCQPKYDNDYISKLIEKATHKWAGLKNPDKWLRAIRGKT